MDINGMMLAQFSDESIVNQIKVNEQLRKIKMSVDFPEKASCPECDYILKHCKCDHE